MFTIDLTNGQLYYDLLYQLAFLVGFLFFLFWGVVKKYPILPWILINLVVTVFFIAGTKIGTYGLEDLSFFLQNGELPNTGSKSLLGGLIGGFIGIWIGKKLTRFRPSVVDGFAFSLPAALILQRIGCLTAGCCFGLPTQAGWGIIYSARHQACHYHMAEGALPLGSEFSLPVHPVPIYLIGGYLLIIILHWLLRNRWKQGASMGLFGLAGLLLLRFGVEFFRDPVTNHAMGELFFGLKLVQWVVLAGMLIALFALWWNEKRPSVDLQPTSATIFTPGAFGLVGLVILLLWQVEGWFTGLELAVTHLKVLFILIPAAVLAFRKWMNPSFRWGGIALTLSALFLMSQTYTYPIGRESEEDPEFSNFLSLGGIIHPEDFRYRHVQYEEEPYYYGCSQEGQAIFDEGGSISQTNTFGFQYTHVHHKLPSKRKRARNFVLSTGVNYSFFEEERYDLLNEERMPNSTYRLINFNVSAGTDWKLWGYRAGIMIGNLNTPLTDFEESPFQPILYLRLGPEKLFLEGGIFDEGIYGPIGLNARAGIGVRASLFKIDNPSLLRFGLGSAFLGPPSSTEIFEHYHFDPKRINNFYIIADIDLKNGFIISPAARFSDYPGYGLSISYRLRK